MLGRHPWLQALVQVAPSGVLLLSNAVSCHEAIFLFNDLYLNVHVGFIKDPLMNI